VENPLSRQGSHLEVQYWHVIADEQKVKDHIMVINGFGLDVNDIVISSLASGSLLATEEEKRQGVLVVDIGKGGTDFVLYRGRRVVQTGVIPVGGDHVTNDLSLGLRVKSKFAEGLKVRSAMAMVEKEDRNKKVPLLGDLSIGDSFHSQLSINKITHARLEELFIILKNRLGSLLTRKNLPCGVILTGGVSKTPLISDLAEVTLDVPVALGESPEWVRHKELREPEYATVLGLLYNALHDQQEEDRGEGKREGRRWLRKMAGLFN
jgi:cell division protein FtsA